MSTNSVPDMPPRVSDHGARVAAGRLGIVVEEYRRRERNGEAWCSGHRRWHYRSAFRGSVGRPNGLQGDCAEIRDGFVAQRRYALTPSGTTASRVPSAAASEGRPDAASAGDDARRSTGHLHCPPSIRHLCLGQLPEGWVWAAKP